MRRDAELDHLDALANQRRVGPAQNEVADPRRRDYALALDIADDALDGIVCGLQMRHVFLG